MADSQQCRHAGRCAWKNVSQQDRTAWGKRLRMRKRVLRGIRAQAKLGQPMFMRLCKLYRNTILRRELTAEDRAYIRQKHAQEIADSIPRDLITQLSQ